MSFSKVVNGVTFTSSNFTNIDVNFEKQGAKTYIYISTTDNHAFNSTTISDYYIVHGYSGLSIVKIELQNDNKTAKITVWTDEFNESNSYNIQQLPLIEKPTQPTQIKDLEHINPSLKADNVTVSITGNTVNLKANSGYKITSALRS